MQKLKYKKCNLQHFSLFLRKQEYRKLNGLFYFLFISSLFVSFVSLSFYFSLFPANDKMIWHSTKYKLCDITLNCSSSFSSPWAFITANYCNRFLLFMIIFSCCNDHKFLKFWPPWVTSHVCRGFFFFLFFLTEHLDAHYHQYICRLLLFISNKALLGYTEWLLKPSNSQA